MCCEVLQSFISSSSNENMAGGELWCVCGWKMSNNNRDDNL